MQLCVEGFVAERKEKATNWEQMSSKGKDEEACGNAKKNHLIAALNVS